MADATAAPAKPGSRFWLFAPFTVVALVIVAWCVAWFVIRSRAEEGIDTWLAREAAAGRQWTCADRSIGGFPFRIEVECSALSLRRGDLAAGIGRFEAVAQIYRPRHVIVRAEGPLVAREGEAVTRATWRLLQSSVRSAREGLQQLSAVMEGAALEVAGATPEPVKAAAERLELYARPSPSRTDDSVDLVARATGAAVPLLDTLLANGEPAQLEVQARASQGLRLAGEAVPEALDRWREAGGALDIVLLSLAKGPGRLEAKGRLALDAERRVEGRIEGAALGLDAALRQWLGDDRASLAQGLLGALAGRPRLAEPGGTPPLQPVPPLRLENGRVFVGPLPIPGVRLRPLY